MSFLKPHVEYASTESNVSSIDIEDEEGGNNISTQDAGGLSITAQDNDEVSQTSAEQANEDNYHLNTNKRKKRRTLSAAPISNTDKVISFLQN